MNVSQHWRMNTYRYQLRATRHDDGHISFAARPEVSQRLREQYLLEDHRLHNISDEKSKVEQIA